MWCEKKEEIGHLGVFSFHRAWLSAVFCFQAPGGIATPLVYGQLLALYLLHNDMWVARPSLWLVVRLTKGCVCREIIIIIIIILGLSLFHPLIWQENCSPLLALPPPCWTVGKFRNKVPQVVKSAPLGSVEHFQCFVLWLFRAAFVWGWIWGCSLCLNSSRITLDCPC